MKQDLPDTTMFDGDQAWIGFALKAMCFSLNSSKNRAALLEDAETYYRRFGLNGVRRGIKGRGAVLLMNGI
jgi:protocatechuate 4,5-dioxygenase, alpha chain